MDLVREYRRRARECRELGKSAAPDHRSIIEGFADMWEKMADDREKILRDLECESSEEAFDGTLNKSAKPPQEKDRKV